MRNGWTTVTRVSFTEPQNHLKYSVSFFSCRTFNISVELWKYHSNPSTVSFHLAYSHSEKYRFSFSYKTIRHIHNQHINWIKANTFTCIHTTFVQRIHARTHISVDRFGYGILRSVLFWMAIMLLYHVAFAILSSSSSSSHTTWMLYNVRMYEARARPLFFYPHSVFFFFLPFGSIRL